MDEIARLFDLLAELKRFADAGDSPREDGLTARMDEAEIELAALDLTVKRLPCLASSIAAVKVAELDRRLRALAAESLGYYGLPLEPGGIGRNEPPIGPERSARLRARLFDRAEAAEPEDDLKDALARKLQFHIWSQYDDQSRS